MKVTAVSDKRDASLLFRTRLVLGLVDTFLLLKQTAVQSSILILSHAVDRILQTCSVVKNSAATIQTDMAVSDSCA